MYNQDSDECLLLSELQVCLQPVCLVAADGAGSVGGATLETLPS
jgi:hypothetical protein